MSKNTVGKSFTMILQVGISMMTPIALCVAVAVWIGTFYDNSWVMPLMLFLGIGAAFRNTWILLKSYTKADGSSESKTNDYIRRLKAEGQARRKSSDTDDRK